MEEKNVSLAKVTFGYGVIVAVIVIIYSLILFVLDLSDNQLLQYVSHAIIAVMIVMFAISYRNKYLDGYIDFGKAYTIAILTVIFAAIFIGIYTFIYHSYIDPGAMDRAMEIAEEKMIDRGLSEMDIENGMAMARKMQSPVILSVIAMFATILVGAILSLLTFIAVKKQPLNSDSQAV